MRLIFAVSSPSKIRPCVVAEAPLESLPNTSGAHPPLRGPRRCCPYSSSSSSSARVWIRSPGRNLLCSSSASLRLTHYSQRTVRMKQKCVHYSSAMPNFIADVSGTARAELRCISRAPLRSLKVRFPPALRFLAEDCREFSDAHRGERLYFADRLHGICIASRSHRPTPRGRLMMKFFDTSSNATAPHRSHAHRRVSTDYPTSMTTAPSRTCSRGQIRLPYRCDHDIGERVISARRRLENGPRTVAHCLDLSHQQDAIGFPTSAAAENNDLAPNFAFAFDEQTLTAAGCKFRTRFVARASWPHSPDESRQVFRRSRARMIAASSICLVAAIARESVNRGIAITLRLGRHYSACLRSVRASPNAIEIGHS